MRKTRIQTPQEYYLVDYPEFQDLADKQLSVVWFSKELGVEQDKNDILVNCNKAEYTGITTVLKIFTLYELLLGGDEFWGDRISRIFPRPEIIGMCDTFAMVERQIHAPFYDLINKTLNIATEEFYSSYKSDPILMDRVNWINEQAKSRDPFISTAALAFMEGVMLFSNFAFLKSFNTRGWNMIPHITAGIDASAKDENFHCMGSSGLHNALVKEWKEAKYFKSGQLDEIHEKIYEIAKVVYEHERRITEIIFAEQGIRTIKKEEIDSFVKHRVDVVCGFLDMPPLFNEKESVVAEWFYTALSAFKYSDFFSATQVQYVRSWDKNKLVWE